jgi:hypothetical protein
MSGEEEDYGDGEYEDEMSGSDSEDGGPGGRGVLDKELLDKLPGGANRLDVTNVTEAASRTAACRLHCNIGCIISFA